MDKYIEKISKVILSNMCMVYYELDNILVINRTKTDWPGLSFPGGHIEDNESILESVIREVKEETSLDIFDPILVDIKEWDWGDNTRYIAFLYKTNKFKGKIKSSKEGEVFWIKKEDINKYPLSIDFNEIFNLLNK